MTGMVDAHGNPRADRQGLLSFVMAKDAGQWQIIVMHNLDFSAATTSKVTSADICKSLMDLRPSGR
jgi:uncharacterized GH25 family protein